MYQMKYIWESYHNIVYIVCGRYHIITFFFLNNGLLGCTNGQIYKTFLIVVSVWNYLQAYQFILLRIIFCLFLSEI